MQQSGFGRFPVTVLPHVLVPLPDGVHLSLKIWFPSNDETLLREAYPVVMEYLPYRKSDFTVPRDYRRHAWMTSHGYVSVRVDMRGTGDSEGLYFDEYLITEQKDACDVIRWLCDQRWCSGKVGMYGKSWGGFNGLQVAYHRPPGLAAVISLYSTDDRYTTDMHWEGGCVLGNGMLSWASRMFLWNCAPPCPLYVANWREEWKNRLEKASESWAKTWLSHQTNDAYWKQGSINCDYSRVTCPVLAIGGWRDAYVDGVFRMVQSLPNVRGMIGPWSHDWPDTSRPGPNIEFLRECLRWWDVHLKGEPAEAQLPKFRIFVMDSQVPNTSNDVNISGKWLTEPQWPPGNSSDRIVTFVLGPQPGLLHQANSVGTLSEEWVSVKFKAASGQWAGEWLSMGGADVAADQQIQDSISNCWTSAPLSEDLNILGFINLKSKIRVEAETAFLAIRVCDVHPNDQSTLITHGLLNLSHHRGHDEGLPEKLIPGKVYPVCIELHATGYTVPIGHKLRVGISSCYWPTVWPAPNTSDVHLCVGQTGNGHNVTELVVPVADPGSPVYQGVAVSESPKIGPPLPSLVEADSSAIYDLTSGFSFAGGQYTRTVNSNTGPVIIKEGGLDMVYQKISTDAYTIKDLNPLSAKATSDQTLHLHWTIDDQSLDADISTHSEMTSDTHNFHLINTVNVLYQGEKFFAREWKDEVPRHLA
ncbi:hypothetical protein CAPTEDRAFT_170378 [Capitella teleta]|uniref:Xaa-Pro dipeptidyl-peptidase C-terminal domain-containing protein n=1 Tax=Capitella teleta TaxID=283909 RepID=R7V0T0_CAPTE|nr:hypothetical protein CAPTEDRAFT_170378 [Capitella teleta]|eukprot:ELU09296.1 hypothetical protein CAPTEDRAFT_170378 [Capitella teleta]